jgi:nitroreductase
MSAISPITERRSIRAYLDQPVDAAMVRELLDVARWAPSGGNLQPWKVIVVGGQAREDVTALAGRTLFAAPKGEADEAPMYPADLGEPYRTRRDKAGEVLYTALGIEREDKAGRYGQVAKNFQFFGAPIGLFFVIDRTMGNGQWAHLGMFMQSLAIAAHERGLGTCMQEAWAMVRKSLHTHFALAENELLYCGMALGWPDPDAPINHAERLRADLDSFSQFHGF